MTDWLVLDRYLGGADQSRFIKGLVAQPEPLPEANQRWENPGVSLATWRPIHQRGKPVQCAFFCWQGLLRQERVFVLSGCLTHAGRCRDSDQFRS